MDNPFTSGPIALYRNVPIQSQFYAPRTYVISDIQLGQTTIVDTVVENDYVIGQMVRLIIPQGYGCTQLNEVSAYVIGQSISGIILDLDTSRNVNQFIQANLPTQAHVLAIADINSGAINGLGNKNVSTSIPGAFVNISPN